MAVRKSEEEQIVMTDERLMNAIMAMTKENQKNMLEFAERLASELRKPDPEEQKKKDDEAKRLAERREQMVTMARREEQMKAARQKRCPHRRADGKSTIQGQIHSDGMFHGVCFRCQLTTEPRPVPMAMLAQGVGGSMAMRLTADNVQ